MQRKTNIVAKPGDLTEIRHLAPINLCGHHAQCELNYHMCISLMPRLRDGQNEWAFEVGNNPGMTVNIALQDAAPYTSTVDMRQLSDKVTHINAPRIRIRLYHDVEMAEVIAWDNHRHWLPVYTYPNRRMYLPDEKLVINRFLGEWLGHCLKLGVACDEVCESIRINNK